MSFTRLPPLNALRAFEAVGRLASIKLAARELGVSPAAVTAHLRGLERHLGLRLTERKGGGIVLTEAGRGYLEPIQQGFASFASAQRGASVDAAREPLRLSVTPSFAVRWLVPRLPTLRRALPQLELAVSTSLSLVDFDRENVHAAIRFGRGDWPDAYGLPLAEPRIVAVASPSLVGREPLPATAIADLPLVHGSLVPDDWRRWLGAAGVSAVNASAGLTFDTVHLALQAAEAGLGVVLTREVLACDALARGTLVAPFSVDVSSDRTYWFVCPAASVRSGRVRELRDWIRDELTGKHPVPVTPR